MKSAVTISPIRSLAVLLSCCAATLTLPSFAQANYHLDFEAFKPGALPAALTLVRNMAPAPTWSIQEVDGGRVLAQQGQRGWEVVTIPGTSFGDLRLTGRIKALAARRVQGFVWRYQDPNNFLLVRSGGDDDGHEIPEVRVDLFYRGKRIPLGGNTRVAKLDVGTWHALSVEHRGSRIRLFLNGEQVHEVVDDYWCRLLPEKGALGFYTFRSQALFDDLKVEDLTAPPRE